MLMDGHIRTPMIVEPRRICDVTAVKRLVERIRKEHVGQLIARILQHGAYIALARIVEEAMRRGVDVAEMLRAERLHDIACLVVQLAEIIGMRLDLDTQPLTLDDRQQFLHGAEEHTVADLLLIRVARELRVDDGYAHADRDLNDALPIGDRMLTLFLGRSRPTIDYDEGGDFNPCLLECLAILRLRLLGEERMLVERVDARVRGLLDVLVAPVRNLVYHVVDAHLLGENINIECDFHGNNLL